MRILESFSEHLFYRAPLGKCLFQVAEFQQGSELLSHEIELRNRVKQNNVKLRVTNSKTFKEILLLSY